MPVVSSSNPNWYLDSGATNHMTHDARTFHSSTPYATSDQVVVGNGDTFPITHSGNLSFSSGSFVFRLSGVLCVPSLRKNLLSVAQFTHDFNVSITFFPWGYQIRDLQCGVVLFQGLCKDGLYPIFPMLLSSSKHAFSSIVASSSLWHHRLGHPSNKVLRTLVSRSLLGSLSRLSTSPCSHCALSKSIKLSFSSHDHCSTKPFALIHSDVWMSLVVFASGYRYYVLFMDDYTRYSWIFPMRLKSEVFGHFSTFAIDRHHGYRCLHPPTGRLYVSRHVIFHEDQLYYADVSKLVQLSDLAVVPVGLLPSPPARPITAVHSQDTARFSNTTSGSTSSPSFHVHPSSPQPTDICAPQSAVSPPSSAPYSPTPPDCRSLLQHTAVPTSSPPPAVSSPSSDPSSQTPPDCLSLPSQPAVSASSPTTLSSSPLVSSHVPVIAPPPPSARLSPVHTRSKSGIVKPNPKYHANFSTRYPVPHAFSALVNTDVEPTCYTQASRYPEWKQAMLDEYHALLQQGTWSLVPSSPSLNTVGCKWVFRIKRRSDSTIELYKARLECV
ncbi:hypothetical protein L3X38_036178 [Prunus dulcis]|uniref:Uncharacterized protein n=1 Tax=Prunus dulcis TaxID=3755 RepID=A0AAD4V2T9_PRUDU|nr:hypothetical protein L3X38_036178 [Prunus dulcis]